MISQEDKTMKRIHLIRRRRYLLRVAVAGFAAALILPTTALARYDDQGVAVVDLYATSSVSAEDDHGLSAANGFVLPAADRAAVELTLASSADVVRADDFAPPRNVTVPTAATGTTTIDWGQIALWSWVGLAGIAALLMLATFMARRGPRAAHS
jgi:hypothetical protein